MRIKTQAESLKTQAESLKKAISLTLALSLSSTNRLNFSATTLFVRYKVKSIVITIADHQLELLLDVRSNNFYLTDYLQNSILFFA